MSGAIALKAPDPAILSRRAQIIADLADFLPAGTVVSSDRELKPFETDGFIAYRRMPLAVTLPRTTEEVAAILKYCAKYKVPVVPRGRAPRSPAARSRRRMPSSLRSPA